MRISLIVAMDRNRIIGHAGALPWHLPADLQWFQRHTMGHTLLMGRRTFEAIGRSLPGRQTLVLSRNADYHPAEAIRVSSIPAALAAAEPATELFICGGGEIYRQTLNLAERIYLTELEIDAVGDTFFPEFSEDEFEIISQEHHADPLNFRFLIFHRIKQPHSVVLPLKETSP